MKKISLLLFIFLACFTVKAQTITEADLLGEWTIKLFASGGMSIDLDTDTFTLSEEALKEIGDKDPETVKKQMAEVLQPYKSIVFVFTPGNKMDMVFGEKSMGSTYTLINKNGKQYMVDGKTGSETSVEMVDGLMHWNTDKNGTEVIMYLRKK